MGVIFGKGRRVISLLIVISLFGTLFIGCSKANNPQSTVATTGTTGTKEVTQAVVSYPLNTDVTLKYWMAMPGTLLTITTNYGETPFAKEWIKRTGVKVEFIHPAAAQATEAFNIMVASNELPDMVQYDWVKYPGGPNQAINSQLILKLNDIYDEFAPNLKKYLKANPDADKEIKTDEGYYYIFPFIRDGEPLLISQGPIFRKDWLDELGMQVPTAIEEWYPILKAFKEKKNAAATLSSPPKALAQMLGGAFDTYYDFYIDNGTVKYGPIEPGRKELLTTLNKWFKEGLLDRNFATLDTKTQDANIMNGKTGVFQGMVGGGMGKWLPTMKEKDPKFDLTGVPYPAPKKGQISRFGLRNSFHTSSYDVGISAKCKNVEIAAKFLDYAYGEEGHLLLNFGVEGQDYKMVNGYPTYTDLIMNNPDGLAVSQAMSKYFRSAIGGPFIQDKRYVEQYLNLPQQMEAIMQWGKNDQKKYQMPTLSPSPEESAEMAKIMNDIKTYADEMFLKFIMGTEPIDNFNIYTEQIKKMGIDRALAIYQNALERYNKR